MKLFELTTEYHRELNPELWSKTGELKIQVAQKLKQIAREFIEFLDLPGLNVEDIVITGSNANYNWTDQSDIDLHVIADLSDVKASCPDLAEDYFLAKKTLWNEHHDITIYDQPVELYVQDASEEHIATGIYSLKNGNWLKKPAYDPPSVDDSAVAAKTKQLKYEIDRLIDDKGDQEAVQKLKEKIRHYRQSGLKEGGEWSTGNLTFKELRNTGYLEKLRDYSRSEQDERLSLK